jgi:hypothetical protein
MKKKNRFLVRIFLIFTLSILFGSSLAVNKAAAYYSNESGVGGAGCEAGTIKDGTICGAELSSQWSITKKSWAHLSNSGAFRCEQENQSKPADPSFGSYSLSCTTNTWVLGCVADYAACSGSCIYNQASSPTRCGTFTAACTAGTCASCVGTSVLCGTTCRANDGTGFCGSFADNCKANLQDHNCASCVNSGYALCSDSGSAAYRVCRAKLVCNSWEAYDACSNTCTSQPLKLGYDSLFGSSVIQSVTYPTLFIHSNNNVGIGTSSNDTKLRIDGGAGIALNMSNGRISGLGSPSTSTDAVTLKYLTDNFAPLAGGGLWSANGGNIYNTSLTGNVGIGTTTPLSKLQLGAITPVSTTTPITLSLGATFSSVAGTKPKLKLYDDGTNYYGLGVSANQFDFMAPANAGYSWGIGGTQRVRIDSSGNLFLDSTSLVAAYISSSVGDINSQGNMYAYAYGNSSGSAMMGNNGMFTSNEIGLYESNSGYPLAVMDYNDNRIYYGGSNWYEYGSNFWWDYNQYSLIIPTGSLGIGTQAPNAKIQIANSTGNVINVTGGIITGLAEPSTSTDAVSLKYLSDNYSPITSILWTKNGNNIYNSNTGNVGIGTTTPGAKLHVNGNFYSLGDINTSGSITSVGSINLTGASGSYPTLNVTSNSNTSWHAVFNFARRSRGTSAAPTAVVNGDTVMFYDQYGHDGSNYIRAAMFNSFVNGTVSTGIVPMGWSWQTMNSSGSFAERMRLTANGDIGIGVTSPSAKLDVAGAIAMHDENQDIDSRYYGGTFLRGWQSFSSGSEANINYVTDLTSPVGNQALEVSTSVWARGPKIPLDSTQNYEVEMWIKREVANTAGLYYFVVSNYDSNGAIINGDGTDWHYPVSGLNQSTLTVGAWTKYRFIVGPHAGAKNHSPNAKFISVGFLANNSGGTDVIRFTGFKVRPIARYNNDPLTLTNAGNVGINTTTPSAKLQIFGVTGVALNMSDGRISRVGDPATSTDAVNLKYLTDNYSPSANSLWIASSSNIYNYNYLTGNVGVGVINPLNKLQVGANPLAWNGNDTVISNSNGGIAINNLSGYSYIWGSNRLDLYGNGINTISLYQGRVGVGITAPGSKFHTSVAGLSEYSGTDASIIQSNMTLEGTAANRTIGTGPSITFRFPANTDGTNIWDQARILATPDNNSNGSAIGRLYLQVRDSYNPGTGGSWNWRTGIMIAGNGNVGIGTTNPLTNLSVSAPSPTIRINSTFNGDALPNDILGTLDYYTNDASSNAVGVGASIKMLSAQTMQGGGVGTSLAFYTRTALGSSVPEAMRIDSSGFASIGTTTTDTRLRIDGSTGVALNMSNGRISGLGEPSANTDAVTLKYINDNFAPKTGGASLWSNNGNTYHSGIGKVGIGTTSPATALHVDGSLTITNGEILIPNGQITVNKLKVNTIDPLYDIFGKKYSSFAASFVGGVKEEVTGKISLNSKNGNEYQAVIDFDKQKVGSDLWVWYKVIDFNKDNVEALITSYGKQANTYYYISGNSLIFKSNTPVEISYRLIAKRFDWRQWPTLANDQTEAAGLFIK